MGIVLGQHVRVGNEDNLWGADRKRRTSVQQVEACVRLCEEFGRKVATADEARAMSKVACHSALHGMLKKRPLRAPRPNLAWERVCQIRYVLKA
jgi:beta-keto acid cleavage enzyme